MVLNFFMIAPEKKTSKAREEITQELKRGDKGGYQKVVCTGKNIRKFK